jgi:hypothetical protein
VKTYRIAASVVFSDGPRLLVSKQLPAFEVTGYIQDARHAEDIARQVVNAAQLPGVEVHVVAVEV